MTIKRAPPHITLSLDDHKKLTTFVALFITIAQKTKTKKTKGKKDGSHSVKTLSDKKTNSNCIDIGPWLSGPFTFLDLIKHPLFLFTTNLSLIQSPN